MELGRTLPQGARTTTVVYLEHLLEGSHPLPPLLRAVLTPSLLLHPLLLVLFFHPPPLLLLLLLLLLSLPLPFPSRVTPLGQRKWGLLRAMQQVDEGLQGAATHGDTRVVLDACCTISQMGKLCLHGGGAVVVWRKFVEHLLLLVLLWADVFLQVMEDVQRRQLRVESTGRVRQMESAPLLLYKHRRNE
jgi:hypothetical protein